MDQSFIDDLMDDGHVQEVNQRRVAIMEARIAADAALSAFEDIIYAEECRALIGKGVPPSAGTEYMLLHLKGRREGLDRAALALPDREDLKLFRPEWLMPDDVRNETATILYGWVQAIQEIRAGELGKYVGGFADAIALGTQEAYLWSMIRLGLDDVECLGCLSFARPVARG